MIILKLISKYGWRGWIGFIWHRIETALVDTDSIRVEEFLDSLRDHQLLEKESDPRSWLVSYECNLAHAQQQGSSCPEVSQ
jgi:hypothetical protein